MNLVRTRRRRGMTVMEVVVAASLTSVFAVLVGASILSTSRIAQVSVERSRMNSEVRQITDLAVKYLRSARPRGACLLPPGTPLASCMRPTELGPAVIYASDYEVWFYGYITGAAQVTTLRSPDCVQVTFTPDSQMNITRFPATATATYTTPAWSPTAEILRSTRAVTAAAPLQFFTSSGDPIAAATPIGTRSCTPPTTPDPRLEQIAMVRVTASAASTRTGAGSVELSVVAELPSTRFRSGS